MGYREINGGDCVLVGQGIQVKDAEGKIWAQQIESVSIHVQEWDGTPIQDYYGKMEIAVVEADSNFKRKATVEYFVHYSYKCHLAFMFENEGFGVNLNLYDEEPKFYIDVDNCMLKMVHNGVNHIFKFKTYADYYNTINYFFMISELKRITLKNQQEAKQSNVKERRNNEVQNENRDLMNEESIEYILEELNSLIGLDVIKNDVIELSNLIKMNQVREKQGLKAVPVSMHLVFTGNPGTGKTTIARILAKIYKQLGVLSKGQLVETERADLVAGYVGQTAIKTQEKIEEALGGILFIDEAYTLAKGGNDFGQEAIDTILKAMEDHRSDFIVIVAGYPDLMENFILSNPGLKSRFNKYINFPDYSVEELKQIFDSLIKKYDYKLTSETSERINELIENLVHNKDENFANARDIRNIFEKIITKQATRCAKNTSIIKEELLTIIKEDIEI